MSSRCHRNHDSFSNDFGISPKVYQLAQLVYHEFECLQRKYGQTCCNRLVPLIIGILEDLDRFVTDKQKLEVDLNLSTAEKNELLVQLNREKELHTAIKRRLVSLEDEIITVRKESAEKLENLESNLRQYQLLTRNANEHVSRLEEREASLRQELLTSNERYTELLKTHIDYMERNKLLDQNPIAILDGHEPFVSISTPTNTRRRLGGLVAQDKNQSPDAVESDSGLISFLDDVRKSNPNLLDPDDQLQLGKDLTGTNKPDPNTSAMLMDAIRPADRASSFVDLYDEQSDFEAAMEPSLSVDLDDDSEDVATIPDVPETNDVSSGMVREVEKLIKENIELSETKNALNIVKNDLIRKLDELTGEKQMLIQELHTLRLGRDECRERANQLFRVVHRCQDQIASLTARLKTYEDIGDQSRYSSQMNLISQQQHSVSCWALSHDASVDDTATAADGRDDGPNADHIRNRNLDKLQRREYGKSVDDLSRLRKKSTHLKTLFDAQGSGSTTPIQHDSDGDWCPDKSLQNAKLGEVCFTKREMARVIAERNQYKERLLELQDAVRLTEEMRMRRQEIQQLHSRSNSANRQHHSGFFGAVQSFADDFAAGMAGLFSTLDEPVWADALPSEAHYVSPMHFHRPNPNESTYPGSGQRRHDVHHGLRRMFSRLFGYPATISPEPIPPNNFSYPTCAPTSPSSSSTHRTNSQPNSPIKSSQLLESQIGNDIVASSSNSTSTPSLCSLASSVQTPNDIHPVPIQE